MTNLQKKHTITRRALSCAFFAVATTVVLGGTPGCNPEVENRTALGTSQETDMPEPTEHRARGTFEVTMSPVESQVTSEGIDLGHSSLEKRFEGDLQGAASGEMLTAVTAVKGSAGYVAIERVRGILQGREGTFLLQHNGLMDRGEESLVISVIPDSGTGELSGLRGTMTITFDESGHSYELVYRIEDQAQEASWGERGDPPPDHGEHGPGIGGGSHPTSLAAMK